MLGQYLAAPCSPGPFVLLLIFLIPGILLVLAPYCHYRFGYCKIFQEFNM